MKRQNKCSRCDGCGQIANDENGSPWTYWERLPEASKLAVRMLIVRPLKCPDCEGSGNDGERPASA